LGTGYDLELCYIGAGAYICNRVIGKKEVIPIKPPFPAVSGLWSNPTVVNNVETIASVPWIVNSGDDYAKIGIGRSTGTKLISASG
jgi:NADH-quinone oxidoreductase subunit F